MDDFKATNPPLMVSVMLWTFPMYILLPIAASFALEPLWRSGVGTQFVRAFCLQLYATWCWHCAFILHERGVFPGKHRALVVQVLIDLSETYTRHDISVLLNNLLVPLTQSALCVWGGMLLSYLQITENI